MASAQFHQGFSKKFVALTGLDPATSKCGSRMYCQCQMKRKIAGKPTVSKKIFKDAENHLR
jgi:hypothetical protein